MSHPARHSTLPRTPSVSPRLRLGTPLLWVLRPRPTRAAPTASGPVDRGPESVADARRAAVRTVHPCRRCWSRTEVAQCSSPRARLAGWTGHPRPALRGAPMASLAMSIRGPCVAPGHASHTRRDSPITSRRMPWRTSDTLQAKTSVSRRAGRTSSPSDFAPRGWNRRDDATKSDARELPRHPLSVRSSSMPSAVVLNEPTVQAPTQRDR